MLELLTARGKISVKWDYWSDCKMTFTDGNYFRVYLLLYAWSWMTTEMAEASNRVNFGSKPGRLTCPEKTCRSDDIGTCPEKKVQNWVSGKYRTGLPVFTKIIGHVGHFRWLGPNVRWEIWRILIEYIKPIGQMSDESWKFFGYTGLHLMKWLWPILWKL